MELTQFRCARCGVPVTRPLALLQDTALLRDDDLDWDEMYSPPPLVACGYYVLSEAVIEAGKVPGGYTDCIPVHEIMLNNEDLFRHPHNPTASPIGARHASAGRTRVGEGYEPWNPGTRTLALEGRKIAAPHKCGCRNKYNRREMGCCGFGGRVGFNVFCMKGHPVGTRISDCCTLHFTHVPLDRVCASQPHPGVPEKPPRYWWQLW